MAKKEKLTAGQAALALEAAEGLIFVAADRLACGVSTLYRYIQKYPAVREALDRQRGKRLDTAESMLWKAVLAGEAWAVCFFLKTQGKQRGYVERQELKTITEDDLNGAIDAELARLAEHRAAAPAGAPASSGNGECPPA